VAVDPAGVQPVQSAVTIERLPAVCLLGCIVLICPSKQRAATWVDTQRWRTVHVRMTLASMLKLRGPQCCQRWEAAPYTRCAAVFVMVYLHPCKLQMATIQLYLEWVLYSVLD